MKINFLVLITLLLVISCNPKTDCTELYKKARNEYDSGNFSRFLLLADSLKKCCTENSQLTGKADSLIQMTERIRFDFSLNEEQVTRQLADRGISFSDKDRIDWEGKGWLEERMIDGHKMYFKRSVSNLILLRKFYEHKDEWLRENASDPDMVLRLKHTSAALEASDDQNKPVVPVNMAITYSITVHPDAVPDGETIRCWMPWPKTGCERQKNVELVSTSSPEYFIAPDSAVHTTLYMETKAKKGLPTVFSISYHYQSNAQYFNLSGLKILPYDKSSALYKKYTAEQLPDINFSENIKKLADSITGGEKDPAGIVRKIYSWFKTNIPWTGALEYSIIPDIPAYVYKNRRGDCGMQTFLFISMLRYEGIPVRWQSGWMVPPGGENLHDWSEVYYEGVGWVPADVSYDLQNSAKEGVRDFYMSGIDFYRLIVNDGVGGILYPRKKYLRSEPLDFQRGEVEWKEGNLYFDKWNYKINIDYLR